MSWHLQRGGVATQSDKWPIVEAASAAGGIPSVSSWRQFGHSWFAGGYDDQAGLERSRSRITERIAGMMHLSPHAIVNEAHSGAAAMKAADVTDIGFGRVLNTIKPNSTHQNWPWECDRFGVEAFGFGVNDVGTGGIANSGSYWPGQGAMWQLVWANTMRSLISRAIAGAIYYAGEGSNGLSPAVWHNPGPAADFTFVPRGPGGSGTGSWVYKPDTTACTSDGYWYTTANGDTMIITVPADYDTGTVTLRHLCPGSWFDGPAVNRDPFGQPAPGTGIPTNFILTGAEHPRSPSAVTVTAPGYSATVNCQGLANRMTTTGNPGPGVIGNPDAMTHVSRHLITPTPGATKTITLTVGGLPSGGWYGFDSWEIEAIPELRPIVVMFNVADPASWYPIYFMASTTGGANLVAGLCTAQAAAYSSVLNAVVAEYADPGIVVADIRSKFAGVHSKDYGVLLDGPLVPGVINSVAVSSRVIGANLAGTGDGTHPHGTGERLMFEAAFDAIAAADLPRGRGVLPFAPGRVLAYGRSSGG